MKYSKVPSNESERKNGTSGQATTINKEPKSSFLCPGISIYPFIHASIHCHAIFCFAFKRRKSISIPCAVAELVIADLEEHFNYVVLSFILFELYFQKAARYYFDIK